MRHRVGSGKHRSRFAVQTLTVGKKERIHSRELFPEDTALPYKAVRNQCCFGNSRSRVDYEISTLHSLSDINRSLFIGVYRAVFKPQSSFYCDKIAHPYVFQRVAVYNPGIFTYSSFVRFLKVGISIYFLCDSVNGLAVVFIKSKHVGYWCRKPIKNRDGTSTRFNQHSRFRSVSKSRFTFGQ